ncbi:MAG: trypsin-like peptidase domain-containing protein, partial [Planctomycetes bacterium]|nr:trypsin-like peptidase domain-containing protein [Planctomycetota bacterium]
MIQRCKKATAMVLDVNDKGIGTAFCVDKGYFVTNSHVVGDVDQDAWLVLEPGEENSRKCQAKVIRRSAQTGFALLRIVQRTGLTALHVAEKGWPTEASTVIAFGFPLGDAISNRLGEYPTITVNVAHVTLLHRSEGALDRIQFDSRLEPGQSGGPLVDRQGNVVGMVQGIAEEGTGVGAENAGISMAVPSRKLYAFLRKPKIKVHSVTAPTESGSLEIDFSVDQDEPFHKRELNVAVVLDVHGKRSETPLKPARDKRYHFSWQLPKEQVVTGPPVGDVELKDGGIRAVLANAEDPFGEHGFRVGDVSKIERVAGGFVVHVRSGEEHHLDDLPDLDLEFTLDGKTVVVPIARMRKFTLRHPRVEAPSAKYEIIVRDGNIVVGKAAYWIGDTGGLVKANKIADNGITRYTADSVCRGKALREIARFKVDGDVGQILPLPAEKWILVRNSGSQIRLLDAVAGRVLSTQFARHRFTDMDISPDGRVVYAVDHGRESNAYGTGIEPHYVHRMTLASGDWEVAPAPKIAFRVEVVSAETFVLQNGGGWIAISLNRWPEDNVAVTELGRMRRVGHAGNCQYDPFRGRLLHGNSGLSSSIVSTFRVGPYGFTKTEKTSHSQKSARGGAVLSADGRFFFHD